MEHVRETVGRRDDGSSISGDGRGERAIALHTYKKALDKNVNGLYICIQFVGATLGKPGDAKPRI